MKTSRINASKILIGSIAAVSISAFTPAHSAVIITEATGSYTQNFDILATSGTTNPWVDDSTLLGWYAAKSVAPTAVSTYISSTGSSTAGGIFSYGANASTERALGSINSNALGNFAYGVVLQNLSGSNLLLDTFSFTGEQWRSNSNATAQSLTFSYMISTSPITVFDAASAIPGGWTSLSSFTFTSPIATGSAVTLDGNLAANRSVKSASLGLTLPADQYIAFRWFDANDTGNDHGLAIDDLSIAYASGGVVGRDIIWSPITGIWDTVETNWAEASAPGVQVAFQESDSVTFDDAGLSQPTVTVAAGGVSVGNVKVTNTTGAYTFIGGSISGTGILTKSGAGKLVLTVPNTYSGGTNLSGGTLSVSADNQLGAASGGVILSSGSTLETTGSITLGAGRALTGGGTLNIAPSTALNVAGSATTGVLTLSNSGSLMFTTVASPQIGGFNIQQAVTLGSTEPIILGGSIVTTQPSGTVVIQAPLSLGTALRVFNIGDGTASVDASITGNITSGSVGGRIHKLGDGTLELLGDNSAMLGGVRFGTAGNTPVNGGTLVIGSPTSLGPGGSGTAGQFQFNAGTLLATAPIQFPSTLSISIGNSAPLQTTFAGEDMEFLGAPSVFRTGALGEFPVHLITTNSNVRFAGLLTGASTDLKISGTGSLTLAAGMTVTADISVEGGKFFIGGNIAGALQTDNRPTITANLGGTVGGSQTDSDSFGQLIATGIAGNPGTISPGFPSAPIGAITATALSVLPDGVVAIQLGGLSTYDTITVNGAISLYGSLTLSLVNGYVPSFGDTFGIILNDDVDPVGGDGAFAGKAEGSSIFVGGSEFQISYVAGDGNDIYVTAVPEPGSAALLLGGLALLGFGRRRRA